MTNNRGFTLVELLLAMAISGVVAVAAYSVFISSTWSSRTQEEVAEVQQNVRVAMDRLTKDIRTAGYGLPVSPTSLDFGGGNVFTSPITTSNSTTGPDSITILGIGYKVGDLKNAASDATCNGANDQFVCLELTGDFDRFLDDSSNFKASRKYISINGADFHELSTTTSDHDRTNKKLKLASTLARDYPDGTPYYILQAVQYTIATDLTGCSSANPCLASQDFTDLRGAGRQPVAEGIEDIQFAYGLDIDRDRRIDYAGSYDAADFAGVPSDDSAILAVRVNVVARSAHIDSQKPGGLGRPAVEDRAQGAADGYRRRVLTKVIKVRNSQTSG